MTRMVLVFALGFACGVVALRLSIKRFEPPPWWGKYIHVVPPQPSPGGLGDRGNNAVHGGDGGATGTSLDLAAKENDLARPGCEVHERGPGVGVSSYWSHNGDIWRSQRGIGGGANETVRVRCTNSAGEFVERTFHARDLPDSVRIRIDKDGAVWFGKILHVFGDRPKRRDSKP